MIPQQQQEEGQFAAGVGGYYSLGQNVPAGPMAELSTQRPPVELQSTDLLRYEYFMSKKLGQHVVSELQ